MAHTYSRVPVGIEFVTGGQDIRAGQRSKEI